MNCHPVHLITLGGTFSQAQTHPLYFLKSPPMHDLPQGEGIKPLKKLFPSPAFGPARLTHWALYPPGSSGPTHPPTLETPPCVLEGVSAMLSKSTGSVMPRSLARGAEAIRAEEEGPPWSPARGGVGAVREKWLSHSGTAA